MKDKTKVLNTYGYMFDKLQFICLIGGRVTNPPPQLGRQIVVYSFSSPPTFFKTSDYDYC